MVVPGSGLVGIQAEKEGLDKIFIEAGFDWREAGCVCPFLLSFRKSLLTDIP